MSTVESNIWNYIKESQKRKKFVKNKQQEHTESLYSQGTLVALDSFSKHISEYATTKNW